MVDETVDGGRWTVDDGRWMVMVDRDREGVGTVDGWWTMDGGRWTMDGDGGRWTGTATGRVTGSARARGLVSDRVGSYRRVDPPSGRPPASAGTCRASGGRSRAPALGADSALCTVTSHAQQPIRNENTTDGRACMKPKTQTSS